MAAWFVSKVLPGLITGAFCTALTGASHLHLRKRVKALEGKSGSKGERAAP